MDGKLSILKDVKPNIVDFKNHLATIFTEVRLKKYIEIRSLDTCEWDCHCGGPAFYAGLIYGNLDSAYEIINKWKVSDILNAYIDAPKKGLDTIINNKTILIKNTYLKITLLGLRIYLPLFGLYSGTRRLMDSNTAKRLC